MSEMKKSADGWNRVLDLVTRQGVDRRQNYWSSIMFMSVDKRQNTDRRWQTAYPQNDRNERRFVMTHDNRTSTRTYKERRKK
jgi:hypothetical protein